MTVHSELMDDDLGAIGFQCRNDYLPVCLKTDLVPGAERQGDIDVVTLTLTLSNIIVRAASGIEAIVIVVH